jgi:SAM-dependent methyltransferase
MSLIGKLLALKQGADEPRLLAAGWDRYARKWKPDRCEVLAGERVEFLGDEWTLEDSLATGSCYGLAPEILLKFPEFMRERLLDPYLPAHAAQGLEIGPGGGRLTALLAPRTEQLHLADAASTMLARLKQRFADATNLRFYHTDGMSLPPLPTASLDYALSFDVFVHFEPRLVFWYLRQMQRLLKPGGVGIVHYANALTPLGWQQFERHLEQNVKKRTSFAAFGVMCPALMERFLQALDLTIVSTDVGLIPRDAVAVFRQRDA